MDLDRPYEIFMVSEINDEFEIFRIFPIPRLDIKIWNIKTQKIFYN